MSELPFSGPPSHSGEGERESRSYQLGSATFIGRLPMLYRSTLRTVCMIGMLSCMLLPACTQESQDELGRSIQNWTGTDGVLDIYAGDKLVRRFIKIDKLSTAYGTDDKLPRPFRYGYGYVDLNFNYQV